LLFEFLNTKNGSCSLTAPALSLSLFKAGIFLVDYIQLAFPSHNFALGAALFNGCPYFHFFSF